MQQTIFIIFLLVLFSCQTKIHECTSCPISEKVDSLNIKEYQMHEPSELALLMQELYDSTNRTKKEILTGKQQIDMPKQLEKMYSAQSINENVDGTFYKSILTKFIATASALEKTEPNQFATQYNEMIAVCLQCHQKICPGPMSKISKLKIR